MRRLATLLALVFAATPALAARMGLGQRLDRLEADIAVAGERLGAFGAPVVLAQWGQPQPQGDAESVVRMNRLENQMRQLNGSIEQLQNQIRVMQDQVRRFQQDTEFRFQELQPQQRPGQPQRRGEAPAARPTETAETAPAVPAGRAGTGAPPAALGQTRAPDPASQPLVLTPPGIAPAESTVIASAGAAAAPVGQSVPRPGAEPVAVNPRVSAAREDYDIAYGYMLRGDYEMAEQAFQQFLRDHPNDRNAGDATYWLGESHYLRRQWRPAAEHFLRASTEFPRSSKAPESLLRLGMTLRQMGQREPACATFAEVTRRYPRASSAVRQRVQTEQRNANC